MLLCSAQVRIWALSKPQVRVTLLLLSGAGAGLSQTMVCLSQPVPSFPHLARTLVGSPNLSQEFWKTPAEYSSICWQHLQAGRGWDVALAHRGGVNSEPTLDSALQGQATLQLRDTGCEFGVL